MIPDKMPLFKDEPDLYRALGVFPGVTRSVVDKAYDEHVQGYPEYDQIVHLAWKLLRDPWYENLYRKCRSLQTIYDSGFFVDRLTLRDTHSLRFDPHLFCTPIHKIIARLKNKPSGRTPIVLLSTGGLSPIHKGHLTMMEFARIELEQKGFYVLGGYLSPSHDDYVGGKYNGEAALHYSHRVHLTHLAVHDSDWLMTDPWEAAYVPSDINFTDVIYRLSDYLNHFIPTPEHIEVAYVFGGDNLGFCRVFQDHGYCVAMRRDAITTKLLEPEYMGNNNRITLCTRTSPESAFSSTQARKGLNVLPERVKAAYLRMKKNALDQNQNVYTPVQNYLIRQDSDSYLLFALREAVKIAFGQAEKIDGKVSINTHILDVEKQKEYLSELRKQSKVLNLDAITGADLHVSRIFNLGDGQIEPLGITHRPGHQTLESQIRKISRGDYLLVDDDSSTGGTFNRVMAMLPDSVKITGTKTLMAKSYADMGWTQERPFFDIVDARDFQLGTKDGGLVIKLPNGKLARAPYMLPYVSPHTRARIPLSQEKAFSLQMWQINLQWFTYKRGDTRVIDLSKETQDLLTFVGFSLGDKISYVCQKHIDMMLLHNPD